MKTIVLPRALLFVLSMCVLSAAGCGKAADPAGAFTWIDDPTHDLSFPLGQTINFEGHAIGPGGISQLEVWVYGELTWTLTTSLSMAPW